MASERTKLLCQEEAARCVDRRSLQTLRWGAKQLAQEYDVIWFVKQGNKDA